MKDSIRYVSNPYDLFLFIKSNIRYGFVDKDGNKYIYKENERVKFWLYLFQNYYLQTPSELLNSKVGACYEQIELIRKWLTLHGYYNETFFDPVKNHSIIYYIDKNNYYFFETTSRGKNGIFAYNNFEDLINDYFICNDIDYLYRYSDIRYHIDFYDYVSDIKNNGKILKIKK